MTLQNVAPFIPQDDSHVSDIVLRLAVKPLMVSSKDQMADMHVGPSSDLFVAVPVRYPNDIQGYRRGTVSG